MAKIWYNIDVCTRNGEKVFVNNKGEYEAVQTLARVRSKGLAYNVAQKLQEIYNKEFYIVCVE